MAQNTVPTGFSVYSPRRLERTAYGDFAGTGMDQFTDFAAQNSANFINLTNVMPAVSMAFQRRWGLNQQGSALSRTTTYQRMFSYAAAQDTTFSGTADTNLLLATDNAHLDILLSEEGGTPSFNATGFAGTGLLYAVTSRDWLYYCDGVSQGLKLNYSQRAFATECRWGIPKPFGGTPDGTVAGTGLGYVTPVLTLSGGGGTGATAMAVPGINGILLLANVTNGGTGYTAPPLVTVTDSGGGGTGASFFAIVDLISTNATFGQVIQISMSGPIILNAGRTYALALKNSVTGHTSDFTANGTPSFYPLLPVAAIQNAQNQGQDTTNFQPTGASFIAANITIAASSVDSQVDTVVLLATSDGGDLEHLYEVIQIPLSSFTLGGGNYTFTYNDTLPDTYNDTYQSGSTLLNQNLWVDVDASGTVIGINDNTPPQNIINKPILHQGRLFATDGRSLYFSKSIDEVTTSTGLITSKWEEAWPGSNVLDIAYDNEEITGLLSDGQVLYIGTTDNVYRLLGSSASNFTIPASIFRGVGVAGQDTWTVIYKDNIPAGYIWITPDVKIMYSDFNTYQEIGKPIYPLLSNSFPDFNNIGTVTGIQSMSYGPYSFAIFTVETGNNPTYLIYDTKGGGWYQWIRYIAEPAATLPANPVLAYTLTSGIQQLFTIIKNDNAGTFHDYLQYFDPIEGADHALDTNNPITFIPWTIETSWLALSDTASTNILNELEVWTDDQSTNATVWTASNSNDFLSPILVKSGPLVFSPLRTKKLYLAGSNSVGRFHKARFFTDATTGLSSGGVILQQFQFEYFPQTRI